MLNLKKYNSLITKVALLKSRIRILKEALSLNDTQVSSSKSSNFKPIISRPTENAALYANLNNVNAIAEIKLEIDRLKSLLFVAEIELNTINICLDSLNRVQKYIIICRYKHTMKYSDILLNLQNNKEFKNQNVWCLRTVNNIHNQSIKVMEEILLNINDNSCFKFA